MISTMSDSSRSLSYLTLLEALAIPWDSWEQCSMGILHVPCPKEQSCIVWTDIFIRKNKCLCHNLNYHNFSLKYTINPKFLLLRETKSWAYWRITLHWQKKKIFNHILSLDHEGWEITGNFLDISLAIFIEIYCCMSWIGKFWAVRYNR